jgi:hypothetical protein
VKYRRTARRGEGCKLALPLLCGALASCSAIPTEYGVPPSTNTGAVSYTVQTRKTGNEQRELSNQVTGTLNSSSYIWQPWFMTTQGTVNVTGELVNGGPRSDRSSLLTGTAAATLMPRSSFPTTLTLERSDSRVAGNLLTTDQTSNRAALAQSLFLPDRWNVQTNLSYDDTKVLDIGSGDGNNATVTIDKSYDDSSFVLDLNHEEQRFRAFRDGSLNSDNTDSATLRHIYTIFDEINVQSSTTALRSTAQVSNSIRDLTSLQGVSTAQWRPPGETYSVNGALRTLTQSLRFSGAGADSRADTQFLTGLLGFNYPLAERLVSNIGVSGTLQSIKSDNLSSILPSGSPVAQDSYNVGVLGGVNYTSLTQPVLGFDYSWNAGANAQSQFGSSNASGQTGTASLGHRISRPLELPLVGDVVVSLSETGGYSVNSRGDSFPVVAHTGAVTKSDSDSNSQTYVRVSATDARDLGGEARSRLQLAEAQFSRVSSIDASRNWGAQFTAQTARQSLFGLDSGLITSANGTAFYIERDVLNMHDLSYRSELTATAIGLGSQFDNLPLTNRVYSQFANRLEYRLGMLVLSFETRLFRREGQTGDLTLFQIRRFFY